ncbi:glucans biosynthesis glucosyltransferase MdoH [Acetobacter thailandicus]|uniref:Glucans biosynthesis glucosyltransferase H n=1 Tax=Acetobacter thailandicus TaxID=1502842 RepID=A0ABT3QE21_9PROT|nr:glucans biosynthesis glucosyltransferase MdoH [Acetobacter thailandicus]MBS0961049.1 glucans biosynthesis glucosyltransferase MdoH [Acetobacter thailandicus]MBS1004580.1 glucans biosynthesis glucosyltransferase MdoH [Acetobacter thailandicus]MCX2563489.1 glucans biosynthesis glucosyltransferase MdoH [Acetobacter thailandicus]NHN94242.1 glucans biosynthesis glucosyltransferase MdoH [Acetobacter thailandicus]
MDSVTPDISAFEALPAESPLFMPEQSFSARPDKEGRPRTPVTEPRTIVLRRLSVLGSALALTVYGAWHMHLVLDANGVTLLGFTMLALFVLLFFWIGLAFTSACAGFFSMLTRGGLGLGLTRSGPLPELQSRTALLLPVYNESPHRVMAGLKAIYSSLKATGQIGAFDLFILSDTTQPDVWIEEEAAFLALRDYTGPGGRVYYRRRHNNTERKAGNIGEWVRRFGGAYAHMVTLDADSVMSGDTLVRMAGAMERHPNVGLIQTLPVIVGGGTLFARMQQFAGRVYGPVIAHGIAWWHGSEGNYWGHNAIIRTRAFASQAGLPHVPGRPPFGGHILSHDFVEAALMRRGGWAIHMVPALDGSYEESPPSLTDVAIRDRRWCQGNLQHMKVLPARGLSWISRMHMIVGIGAYVTSPLWLIFLLTGICISLQAHFQRPEYFGDTKTLYPNWPHVDPVQAKYVFIGTMLVLLAPKFLAYIALLFDKTTRKGCGGFIRAAISVLVETFIGGLIAPVAMLIQTSAVVSILSGHDSGWNAQRRDDGDFPVKIVVKQYTKFTLFGLVLGCGAWIVSSALFFWMTPVLLGLLLAIPLVVLTSSRKTGEALRRAGVLLIPEETYPPEVLVTVQNELKTEADILPEGAISALRKNKALRKAHLEMLPRPRQPGEPISADRLVGLLKVKEAPSVAVAEHALTIKEKAAVLGCREGVEALVALPEK